jgi:hypothetical protein
MSDILISLSKCDQAIVSSGDLHQQAECIATHLMMACYAFDQWEEGRSDPLTRSRNLAIRKEWDEMMTEITKIMRVVMDAEAIKEPRWPAKSTYAKIAVMQFATMETKMLADLREIVSEKNVPYIT